MDPSKLGDSYDIVKQSLLRWLAPCGTWAVHPMLAKDYGQCLPPFIGEFSRFLGARCLTGEPVPHKSERKAYFERTTNSPGIEHLLLDPDTGLAMPSTKLTVGHLAVQELSKIARSRPRKLTLVFDQSFSRMKEQKRRLKTKEKLLCLKQLDKQLPLYGIAYFSHANFVLVSTDKKVLENAKHTLLEQSGLPEDRFIEV